MSNPITNGHQCQTGLVLDGHYGWHNHARMIGVATDLGWEISAEDQAIVDRYDAGDSDPDSYDHETVVELMDAAESWLNANTSNSDADGPQPGYLWYWSDGEFFLSPMCDDDDCDDETCAHWSFQ